MAYPPINFFSKNKKPKSVISKEVVSCLRAAAKLAQTIIEKGLFGSKDDTRQASLRNLQARLKEAQSICENEPDSF